MASEKDDVQRLLLELAPGEPQTFYEGAQTGIQTLREVLPGHTLKWYVRSYVQRNTGSAISTSGNTNRIERADDVIFGVNEEMSGAVAPMAKTLSKRAEAVYRIIVQDGPITGREICAITRIDQSTLTSHIIPELKELRGVTNDRNGAGYYSPQHYREQ
jgi:hypothetical protein